MRFLLLFILLFFLYLFVKGLIGYAFLAARRRNQKRQVGGEMVRDPVCEIYIPRNTAVTRQVEGETVYFCSETCARAYGEKR